MRYMLGREHPGKHRIVAALDARHVHEAGGASDERSTGKNELRHRLPTAFRERARTVGEPFAAFKGGAHQRVGFESLKFGERRKVRILVVEMEYEAD